MNALELHAIGLARCGDWMLIDAIEVVARAAAEVTFIGILHRPGDLALLGYASKNATGQTDSGKCEECDGDGEIEVSGNTGRNKYVSCPWCDGDGYEQGTVRDPFLDPPTHWKNMNGETVAFEWNGGGAHWLTAAEAEKVVASYRLLVDALTLEIAA